MSLLAPNPRLQRTRAALLRRSLPGRSAPSGGGGRAPLSRQPLGRSEPTRHDKRGISVKDTTITSYLLLLSLLSTPFAHAEVKHVPIKSHVNLNPGQSEMVTIESNVPLEVGWLAIQKKPCTTNCVEAVELTKGDNLTMAASLGASRKYVPADGKIKIEYRNASKEPVEINIFTLKRICEAESCAFVDSSKEGTWLVIKVDEFKSMRTSKDGSYSVITGITVAGKPFSAKLLWWTDDPKNALVNCSPSIQKYLDTKVPKEDYRPYIISGSSVGAKDLVLRSIDTCAPKAPKFGVPEKNV